MAQGQGRRGRRRAADRGQGRRAGLGRGDRPGAGEDRQRRGARPRAAFGRRRDHRVRRDAGRGLQARRSSASTSAPTRPARAAANQKGVEIRYYSIIYDLVDDIKAAASGLLKAEVRERSSATPRSCEVFKVIGRRQGRGLPGHRGRGAQVGRRAPAARQRGDPRGHAEDAEALQGPGAARCSSGQECGMAFENYEDIREDDVIEIFERETVERTL